ncbi:LysE family translocator [Pseudovibrio exalbescens]|uniref:Lysine transporter LysE n=1 Tax=Pseudovibrio exalbescens TaxID=197461 RepID=A0A1U7JIK7_9HYPH|nr:LysE family translocator [Pseudovibrio exalbescens]OKL44528.1 lysine transporter LysE [Pseudovibrio exalbescens]
MDFASLLLFAGTLFVAAITPGPGIAALVARVLGGGSRGTPVFCMGMVSGDMVWFTLAALGMAAIANTFAWAFVALKYVGAAYLLFLAWKMWRAGAFAADKDVADGGVPRVAPALRTYLAGLTLTLSNPKVVLFYMALLPNLVPLEKLTLISYGEMVAVLAATLVVVLTTYVVLASRARKMLTSDLAIKRLTRTASGVMVGAAVAIVTR